MILQYLRATPCAPSTPSREVHSRGDANYGLCGFADFISLLTDDDGDPFQPNLRLLDEQLIEAEEVMVPAGPTWIDIDM